MARGQAGAFSPNPNGVVCGLDAAFAMKPAVVFLISDGQFEQIYPQEGRITNEVLEDKMKELQLAQPEKVSVHFVGLQMKADDKGAWERLVRRTEGDCGRFAERADYPHFQLMQRNGWSSIRFPCTPCSLLS